MPAAAKPAGTGRTAIPHFPGLEGLRGLAVVAVVFFHARYDWMRGGFLGVSTFFTLSGFLITSLLLNERGATGSIDLGQFWRRRFRRLMPAALAALALVAAYGWLAAAESQRRNLAGDVLAALAYVANWRFLFANQSYGEIFGQASPIAHFWSLAIEEQFYLFLPLLAWFLLIKLRAGRAAFALCLFALTAGSLALTLFAGLSSDAIYYNTGTRAVELLVGALLAVAVFDRRVTRPLGRNRGVQFVVCVLGIAAATASVWLWTFVEQDGRSSPGLYRGGFAAYSLLTAAVILSAVTPAGPVRWLLKQRPMTFLGKISYGIYLYHWPVFLWLDSRRTGLDEPALSIARLSATLAIAIVSYHVIESPIRHGKVRLRLGLAVPAMVGIAASVIATTVTTPKPVIDFEDAQASLSAMEVKDTSAAPVNLSLPDPPHPRVSIFGDSTAMMTGFGLVQWADTSKQASYAGAVARLGCGIGRGGDRMDDKGEVMAVMDICNRWELEFPQTLENGHPNIAIVQTGPWEVANRRLEGSERWTHIGEPEYDKFLMDEMLRAVDVLSSQGATVAWLTSPYIRVDESGDGFLRGEPSKPERMDRLNEMIRELPAKRPGRVVVVDLAGWTRTLSPQEDRRMRKDGVHYQPDTAKEVMDRFLGTAIVDAFRQNWSARAAQKDSLTEDPEAVGKYIKVRYKVLVVGDREVDLLVGGLRGWGDRFGREKGLEVTTQVRAECGLLRTAAREGPTGSRDPTPEDCQSFRQSVLDEVERVQPDFVLVVPSAWDLRQVRLTSTSTFATWGDATFEKSATQHIQELVRQVNDLKAVVLWANVPVGAQDQGGPNAVAKQIASADEAVSKSYDAALEKVEAARGKGFQRMDMAAWASNKVPSLTDGSDLTDEIRTTIGEWFAKQAFAQYDYDEKLKPPPPPKR